MKSIPLFAVTLSVVFLAGCGPKPGPEKAESKSTTEVRVTAVAETLTPVRVATAKEQEVLRDIKVTGSVAATQSVELAAKVSARITLVAAREGEAVRKGQLLVQQDTADLDTQVRSANAQIQNAKATIESARASYQNAEVKLAQAETNLKLTGTQSDTGVKDAEQSLASAKAQLEIAKKPQRTQEVSVAENAVVQAQANYDRAVSDRKRYESLVREGAAAQITLDQYVTQAKVAKSQLDTAKAQLDLARVGGRDESVRQAETAVSRAEWALKLAKSNTQQVDVRKDDIKAARAGVAQAKAALGQAEAGLASAQAQLASALQQVSNTKVYAPMDGIVARRTAEIGQLAGPSAPLLTVVALDTVFFEAQVPETEISSVRVGMPVAVSLDAQPGRTFDGAVAKLYPTGSTSSRTFTVRVEVPNAARTLRPGMFARGTVVLEKRHGIVISKDALVKTEDGAFAVFVVTGDVAQQRKVTLGVSTAETIEIRGGIKTGDAVVVTGQNGLTEGKKVRVVTENKQTALR